MASRLIYVMDPMCSWCWGFAPVMQALAEQAAAAGVPLHLVAGGLRREQQPLDAKGRERILGYWDSVAQATGQAFDRAAGMPAGMCYDTEPACRALVTARTLDPARVWPLALGIQEAFYTQGRDVTQAAELRQLAVQAGLDEAAFAGQFDSQALREATHADCEWALNLGIAGFPTVLAEHDGRLALLTNGYQPQQALAPLLGRWLEHRAHA